MLPLYVGGVNSATVILRLAPTGGEAAFGYTGTSIWFIYPCTVPAVNGQF